MKQKTKELDNVAALLEALDTFAYIHFDDALNCTKRHMEDAVDKLMSKYMELYPARCANMRQVAINGNK